MEEWVENCWKGVLTIEDSSYFVTSKQNNLGIAKLKNVFRSFLTNSKKLLRNFKIFYLVEFSTG